MTTTKFYVYIFIRIMSYADIVPVLFQYGLQHLVYISKKKANLKQIFQKSDDITYVLPLLSLTINKIRYDVSLWVHLLAEYPQE